MDYEPFCAEFSCLFKANHESAFSSASIFEFLKYFPTRQSLQRALQNHYSNTPKSYECDLQRRIQNPAKHKERFVKIVNTLSVNDEYTRIAVTFEIRY